MKNTIKPGSGNCSCGVDQLLDPMMSALNEINQI
jgi:hypothetical protein